MNDIEKLLAADQARREAMASGKLVRLADLLSDDLVWTHSSGKTDDKKSFLEKLQSRTVLYHALDAVDQAVSQHGDLMICHGSLTGSATVGGKVKILRNRFLSVWKKSGDSFEMLAWQSTGF